MMMQSHYTLPSPLGRILLCAADDQLIRVSLDEDSWTQRVPVASREDRTGVLADAKQQLEEYFAGTRRDFELPLCPEGTEFQNRVWRALGTIPYGETTTYGAIARGLEAPTASRAVGAANGQNPIAIIVPCHRVIGESGKLTGYAGGLWRKEWLLAHEAKHAGQATGRLL